MIQLPEVIIAVNCMFPVLILTVNDNGKVLPISFVDMSVN